MPCVRQLLAAPRLDWALVRDCVLGAVGRPSRYTAYLLLWDADRLGAAWFAEHGEAVATQLAHARRPDPSFDLAYPLHVESVVPEELCFDGDHPSDAAVLARARRAVKRPIPGPSASRRWRSVQVRHHYGYPGAAESYRVLEIARDGPRLALTLMALQRPESERIRSFESISPATLHPRTDLHVELDVPCRAFQAAYAAAMGRNASGPAHAGPTR